MLVFTGLCSDRVTGDDGLVAMGMTLDKLKSPYLCIQRIDGEWTYHFKDTPAQRMVLNFAGFPAAMGRKYKKLDASAVYNREALNWLWRWQRAIKKILNRMDSY